MLGETSPQVRRVAELLERGFTRRGIAAELHVSPVRVTQIIGSHPELIAHQRRPSTSAARLYSYREDLVRLRHAALSVARAIRADLRNLDEELEAYHLDKLLGLRPG